LEADGTLSLDNENKEIISDSDDEFPELADLVKNPAPPVPKQAEKTSKGRKDTGSGTEAERQELMKYAHLDIAMLKKANEGEDLSSRLCSIVDDPCLEHVLSLDDDTVGGGGISYLFKKTKGSQALT
jgi:hypothetical protein